MILLIRLLRKIAKLQQCNSPPRPIAKLVYLGKLQTESLPI